MMWLCNLGSMSYSAANLMEDLYSTCTPKKKGAKMLVAVLGVHSLYFFYVCASLSDLVPIPEERARSFQSIHPICVDCKEMERLKGHEASVWLDRREKHPLQVTNCSLLISTSLLFVFMHFATQAHSLNFVHTSHSCKVQSTFPVCVFVSFLKVYMREEMRNRKFSWYGLRGK